MNMLADGASWMFAALKQSTSATVTLRRTGQSDTTGVKATIGKSEPMVDEVGAVIVDSNSDDYLIAVADYAFGGTASEPTINDVIIRDGTQYGVLPFAGGPCWQYADTHNRTTYRIHTKQKS